MAHTACFFGSVAISPTPAAAAGLRFSTRACVRPTETTTAGYEGRVCSVCATALPLSPAKRWRRRIRRARAPRGKKGPTYTTTTSTGWLCTHGFCSAPRGGGGGARWRLAEGRWCAFPLPPDPCPLPPPFTCTQQNWPQRDLTHTWRARALRSAPVFGAGGGGGGVAILNTFL